MNLVDVIDPDRHPGALVGLLIGPGAAGRRVRAAPSAALAVTAQEDLVTVAAHSAEDRSGRRVVAVPLECLGPSEPGEPRKARLVGRIVAGVSYVEGNTA